jgi:peptidyl-prolyl cis-trans isomerase-like 4
MSVLLETTIGDVIVDLSSTHCPDVSKNFIKMCKIGMYNNCPIYKNKHHYLAQNCICIHQTFPVTTNSLFYGMCEKEIIFERDKPYDTKKKGIVLVKTKTKNYNSPTLFITTDNLSLDLLNYKFIILGEISEGFDILSRIDDTKIIDKNSPTNGCIINNVIILEDPFLDFPGQYFRRLSIFEDKQLRSLFESKIYSSEFPMSSKEDQLREEEAASKAILLEMIGDIPNASVKPSSNVLFICKLNPATVEEDLELLFSQFGKVTRCEIIRDWKTGESLNYGFIGFDNYAACERAYFKMNNVIIDDRRIKVDFSQSVANLWRNRSKI